MSPRWEHITPRVVAGHSSGEIAAAYSAGGISRQSAWKIAYHRGEWSSKLEKYSQTKGSMLAVGLPAQDISPFFKKVADKYAILRLTIACINSPKSITVSGEKSQINYLKSLLDEEQAFCRKLKVNVAYHSFQMHEIATQYLTAMGPLEHGSKEFQGGRPQMVSSVTETWVDPDRLVNAEYWVENMVSQVRFSDALTFASKGVESPTKKLDGSHRRRLKLHHIIEIGPHSVLKGPIKDILASARAKSSTYSSCIVRDVSAVSSFLAVAGALYSSGYEINLAEINGLTKRKERGNLKCLNNLPEYPFNHTNSYWHEAQASRNIRMPTARKHELLGAPDPDWNPYEPRWRHIMRTSINSSVLYPGAGMAIMAVEAAKQLCRDGREISSFTLQVTRFHAPIQIPEQQYVETSFCMTPVESMKGKDSDWYDFSVYTRVTSSWIQNCTGTIQAQYHLQEPEGVGGNEAEYDAVQVDSFLKAQAKCTSGVNMDSLYSHLRKLGYEYGDTFKGIQSISMDPGDNGTLISEVANTSATADSTIHPAALDALLQIALCSATECGTKNIPTCVPTSIGKLWMAADGHPTASETFKGLSKGIFDPLTGFQGPSIVFGPEFKAPIIILEGLECSVVGEAPSNPQDQSTEVQLASEVEWKPDIRLMDNASIEKLFNRRPLTELTELLTEPDFVLLARVLNALSTFSKQNMEPKKPYMRKYLEWANQHKEQLARGELKFSSPPWKDRLEDWEYIHNLENRLLENPKMSKFATLPVSVGRNLIDLLSDAIDPLQFFFSTDILEGYYVEALEMSNLAPCLSGLMEMITHANPGTKILEVGAGTGAATEICLRAVGGSGNDACWPRYSHWDYTDISRSFFGKAGERFAKEGNRMSFKVLNIENDPEPQGFECGTYDVVLALSVLHATKSLERSLTNARRLLKPEGKLIIIEVMNPFRNAAIFVLIEGWWLSTEPYRAFGPCVDRSRWHDLLLQTGFSGCDSFFPDFEDPSVHENAIIVSAAVDNTTAVPAPDMHIEIVYEPADTAQSTIASSIEQELKSSAALSVACTSLEAACPKSSDLIRVFLLEYGKPILYYIDEMVFTRLQDLLVTSATTLWVTQAGDDPSHQPKLHLIQGLFRTLQSEYGQRNRFLLSLNGEGEHKSITQMIHRIIAPPSNGLDAEYMVQDGRFMTPRLINSHQVDHAVSLQVVEEQQNQQQFGSGSPLRLDTKRSNMLGGFKFVESDIVDILGDKQAEVEIKYVGVNFRDVLMALGQPLEGEIGQEASGIITRVGAGCTQFKKGDLVAGIPKNCLSTRSVFDEGAPVVQIPEGWSFTTAASIPTNFMTAYFAVKEIANIQPGESILIHSGAGGTGQAAIQLAQYFGAKVFTTVGSHEKKQFVMEQYHIPESQIFSSRTTYFEKAIMRITEGKGVDVVLNALAGEALVKSWDCIAAHGRFVEIGKKDIMANSKLPMNMFLKNVTFSAFDLGLVVNQRPASCLSVLEKIMDLLAEGKLQPPQPISLFGLEEMEKAFRLMQSGKNHGKMILEMRPGDVVTTVLKSKPNSSFNENATYLIAGGLGGLGQSMMQWLVSRGARNLVVLSRSGERKPDVKIALDKLRSQGVKVLALECDVSCLEAVQSAVKECSCVMPPIKGCIQAAMVLDDTIFEDMSYESWQTVVKPKVLGSWNLHEALPQGLDFFIMLSSMNGITGIQGQANYAAGNTFQDALAHYRVSQGENATSLDLGIFTFTGRVARDPKLLAKVLASYPQEPVTELQFYAVLDSYCDPTTAHRMGLTCQPSVGIKPREGASARHYWLDKPMLQYLALQHSSHDSHKSQGQGIDLTGALQQANSLAEAADHVTKALSAKLSATLSIDVGELDANKPLHQYGVDSLVAVELRTWFSKEVLADIATFDILGRASIASLGEVAASRSRLTRGWST